MNRGAESTPPRGSRDSSPLVDKSPSPPHLPPRRRNTQRNSILPSFLPQIPTSQHERLPSHSHPPNNSSPPPSRSSSRNRYESHEEEPTTTPLELFFDLFLIANLSTFTANHSITSRRALYAYIGLFAVLWSTWWHVTIYDVRFASIFTSTRRSEGGGGSYSLWETACKTVQLMTFVGFALVGTGFVFDDSDTTHEGRDNANNSTLEILAWLLFISRVQLAVQYGVVLVRRRMGLGGPAGSSAELTAPLAMMITTFVLAAATFVAITRTVSDPDQGNDGFPARLPLYLGGVVMGLETLAVLIVSSVFRSRLGFEATHLTERMGLLTLIVIGEGAIGVTKTVGKIMGGDKGLTTEGMALIQGIVVILVLLFTIHFTTHPDSPSPLNSILHFPLHLAIIGIVEGSQQVTLAHAVLSKYHIFTTTLSDDCLLENLEGEALAISLTEAATKALKATTGKVSTAITTEILRLGNETGLCSASTVAGQDKTEALAPFDALKHLVLNSLFAATSGGKKDVIDSSVELATVEAGGVDSVPRSTYITLYTYYCVSIALFSLSSIALMVLHLRYHHESQGLVGNKLGVFRRLFHDINKPSLIARALLGLFAAGLSAAAGIPVAVFEFLRSGAVIPAVVAGLLFVVVGDWWGRRRRRAKGQDSW